MLGRLEVVAGPDTGRCFELVVGQTLVIGRGRTTATRLTDPRVSRIHCVLEVASDRFRLTDSGSVSGTLVNGRPVTLQDLVQGDTIRIGETTLRLSPVDVHDRTTVGADQRVRTPSPPWQDVLDTPSGPLAPDPVAAAPSPRIPPRVQAAPVPRPAIAPVPNLSGHTVSHYAIVGPIAVGRSGVVYRARDLRDGRDVAFKVLGPEYSARKDKFRRFARAIETVIALRHTNIVAVYAGAGKTNDVCWIAMEYVEGESLAKVIQRAGPANMVDWRFTLGVGVHIARALDAAHRHHIIHRNITPSNILIRKSDTVAKLNDLILAKATEDDSNAKVTAPGELLSDLNYTPPERTRQNAALDARSDIYSLGATLYTLLTARPPFVGNSLSETVAKIRTIEPIKPKKYQLAIPDLFQEVILSTLAKSADDRPQSAAELVDTMERIASYEGLMLGPKIV
jgi:pSer/pThr/pTyr-binding forkhead associated (FHA) protein